MRELHALLSSTSAPEQGAHAPPSKRYPVSQVTSHWPFAAAQVPLLLIWNDSDSTVFCVQALNPPSEAEM